MQVVVVTGMSGSGKSTVMDVMEDIGYYCIDNYYKSGRFICECMDGICKDSWIFRICRSRRLSDSHAVPEMGKRI